MRFQQSQELCFFNLTLCFSINDDVNRIILVALLCSDQIKFIVLYLLTNEVLKQIVNLNLYLESKAFLNLT